MATHAPAGELAASRGWALGECGMTVGIPKGPPPPELEALPNIEKLSERVLRVMGLNPSSYTLQGTNNYVLGTGKDRIIIDTGEGIAGWDVVLKQALEQEGASISHILLTHHHHDHIGGIDQVCSVCASKPRIFKKLATSVGDTIPSTIYEDIRDGDVFRVPGATVRAVATPGHCDDHMAFFLEEEQAIFAGDCVLGFGTTVFRELKEYMDSLKKMLNLGEIGRVYPGHGPVIADGKGKLQFYIKHRQDREDQIVAVLQHSHADSGATRSPGSYEPWTIKEMVKIIYAAYPPHLQLAAEGSVTQHLGKLIQEGRVKVAGDAEKYQLVHVDGGESLL